MITITKTEHGYSAVRTKDKTTQKLRNSQPNHTTMKTLRAYRDNGTAKGEYVPGWQFGTFKGIQVGNGATRNIAGWELRSPDGVVRFSEGNYQQFVPFANTVLSNYGCKPTMS